MSATIAISGAGTFKFMSGAGSGGIIRNVFVTAGSDTARLDVWQGGTSGGTNLTMDQKKASVRAVTGTTSPSINGRISFNGDLLIRLLGTDAEAFVELE